MFAIGLTYPKTVRRREGDPLNRRVSWRAGMDAWIRLCWLVALALVGLTIPARAVAPVPPTNCVAVTYNRTATNATIELRWNDNSTTETEWIVLYSIGGGGFNRLGSVSSSTGATTGPCSGITWSGAVLDTAYHFKILSSNGTEESTASNVATVGTFDLESPINLSVTALDPFNVTMGWEEGSTSEDGFVIERKIGTGSWECLGYMQANTLSVSPSPLIVPMATCSFRVRAYKGGVPSTPGSAVGATAVSAYSNEVAVSAPAYALTANAVSGQTRINLSWPNILNEAGYQIFYLAADAPIGTNYSLLDSVAADVTTYQVTSPVIEAGKTYSFYIKPHDGYNYLGESTVASVTVDGITSKTGTSGTPGSAFSHVFTQVSGAAVSSRTLAGVPNGLVFHSDTGALIGVYPPVGNYALDYTVNLTGGGSMTQTFYIRVRPAAGAPVVGTIIPVWNGAAGASRDTPLAGTFTDAEAESAVRVSTTLGNMDFILFNTATPATVTNFMNYVSAGQYTDVDFHRSISSFMVQTGGFKGAGSGSQFTSVVTRAPVVNEPGIANVRGTVSMAKLGGDPNSATSQFFVSLGDNRSNLDYQNGGFTVFGRVAGNGMAVADAISALPTSTYNLLLDGSVTATPFADFPMNAASAPDAMDQTKLVKINSVTVVPTMNYSITGNTHPSVASATIVAGQLHLVGLAGGQTTLTLAATNLDNLTTTQTVVVNITDTYATWAARNTFPGGQSAMGQNPDADGWTNLQEYAFLGDPALPNAAQSVVFGAVTGVAPAARYLNLTFPVRKATQGLNYAVEANNSLSGTWTEIWKSADGFAHAQVVSAVDQTDRTVVTIKDTAALSGQRTRFLRVRVAQE